MKQLIIIEKVEIEQKITIKVIKRLRDNARDKYRNLTEKEKKKRKFGRNRYNISEKKKKEIKTKRISKNYCGSNKSKRS